ncbi:MULTISPECIES: YtzI protein [Virgibacillus]|uniref:Tumour necrosis factor receptor superfamily member 19 n=1 Tax=Virgibacillus chiguensis TaxID=411959 RepID=A0A1M5QFT4_9BACI|nr:MULTISPECIES: YtzI protein [Virgibacillus]SHH12927.1 Tumour necrosis factor receptor superfamily member 19 [Virgibacillus chiguensis]
MSTIMIVSTISFVVVILVLVLSLITIKKGYAYKHQIDPLPEEGNDNNEKGT